jgi:hypothetical protein
MKTALLALLLVSALQLAAHVDAWPCLSCATYTCTDGWTAKTSPPLANS